MTTEYIIGTKGNVTNLVLIEMGKPLSHNYQSAAAPDRTTGTDLVIQWVIVGSVGASISLSYKNQQGQVSIVKESKITSPSGIHESGSVFQSP